MLGIRHRTRPPLSRPRHLLVPCFGLPILYISLGDNIGLPGLGVKVSLNKNEPIVTEIPDPADEPSWIR